jgi:hypothetical protein
MKRGREGNETGTVMVCEGNEDANSCGYLSGTVMVWEGNEDANSCGYLSGTVMVWPIELFLTWRRGWEAELQRFLV